MCSRLVRWIIEHESDQDLRFASLRSDAAVLALGRCGVSDIDFETMYLIEDGRLYTRSDAVAYSARHLRWPWRVLATTTLIPRPARDENVSVRSPQPVSLVRHADGMHDPRPFSSRTVP